MAETEDSSDSFIYDAFISYRHVERDRKWAEWLIEALERYRVPKSLRDKGFPERLRKIFRDEDEVPASADLTDQIRQALAASRFLIVVCSAFTPRSQWVCREIEIFNELGRGDHVLALLTEGEPADSFPAPMLERWRFDVGADGSRQIVKEPKEPLAADVRPRQGVSMNEIRRVAMLRLVAVILGVKFDDLRQRDHARVHRRHLAWMSAAAAVLLLLAGSGFVAWDMMRPTTASFRALAWRWGLPEGVGPIDAETRAHIDAGYSITSRRSSLLEPRRVVEVRLETGSGTLRANADDQARWAVHYSESGVADRIEIFDATGRLIRDDVMRRVSPDTMIVTFERDNVPVTMASRRVPSSVFDPNSVSREGKTEITRYQVSFDRDGRAAEHRYQDFWGAPRRDAQNSFGRRFSYSPEGLILRRSEIGPDGADITLRNGLRATMFAYDRQGERVRQTFMGEDGRPLLGEDGYGYVTFARDPWGNVVEEAYYGPDGTPALNKWGFSRAVYALDALGRRTRGLFYGTDGRPAPRRDGGHAGVAWEYDSRGYESARAFFGADGEPTLVQNGYARWTFTRDANGRIVEERFFGLDGKPILSKDGYAVVRELFDGRGNNIETNYFGVDGEPIVNKQGLSKIVARFDSHDRRVALNVFNTADEPTLIRGAAFSGFRLSYDVRGNLVSTVYLGTDGNPTPVAGGLAQIVLTYDARGNQTESAFLDSDGKRVLATGGYAGIAQSFDDRGNPTETVYLGLDRKPIVGKDGTAGYRSSHDARGNEIERAYFDAERKPTRFNGGYVGYRQSYDGRGNRIGLAYLDGDGKPVLSVERIARIAYRYDRRGLEVERTYFGLDDKPTLASFGYAGYRSEYDARGNLLEKTFLDVDGRPVATRSGHATLRQAFDVRGYLVETVYLDARGNPTWNAEHIARVSHAYNNNGDQIESSFFGVDGKPVEASEGYARIVQTFDARGEKLSQSYFDVAGRPAAVKSGGQAKVTWRYDTRGNLVEEAYFGPDGSPRHDDGCVRIVYTYDRDGREKSVTYFDAADRELHMQLVVRGVIPGSTAANLGLATGDRIISYSGEPATSIKRFQDLTNTFKGFRVVVVRRGDRELSFVSPGGTLGVYLGLVRRDEPAGGEPAPTARAPLAKSP
jgi:YD repeat-containing protein